MKTVKITLNDKVYEKSEPSIKDWYDNIDAREVAKPGVIGTKKGADMYFNVVAKYLHAELFEIIKYGKLKEITDAYKTINANVIECFGEDTDPKN